MPHLGNVHLFYIKKIPANTCNAKDNFTAGCNRSLAVNMLLIRAKVPAITNQNPFPFKLATTAFELLMTVKYSIDCW